MNKSFKSVFLFYDVDDVVLDHTMSFSHLQEGLPRVGCYMNMTQTQTKFGKTEKKKIKKKKKEKEKKKKKALSQIRLALSTSSSDNGRLFLRT